MIRTSKTEGIIIKRRNIGEADRFITVFTKNHGKITVKAVGVRRIMSRRSPHVELLNHSVLTLYKGNGHSLPILTETEGLEDYSEVKKDLMKIGYALHICELIDGLCPENQENKSVFFLLQSTLARLSQVEDIVFIIHEFEIELLTLLGYWHKPQVASQDLNTQYFIEGILERKLRSRRIFEKLNYIHEDN